MRVDPATKIKYASKYARVANYWKKWIGEVEGLKKSNAVEKKKQYEQMLISKNPGIKTTIDQLTQKYNEQAPYNLHRAYYSEIVRNSDTFTLAGLFNNYIQSYEAGKMDAKNIDALKARLADIYKDYDAELDAKVTAKILALYANKTEAKFLPKDFDQLKNETRNLGMMDNVSKISMITGRTKDDNNVAKNMDKLFADQKTLIENLKKDPLIQMFGAFKTSYLETTDKQVTALQTDIDALQKKFMAQQMETDKDRKFFPDANSTLRVTYGKVKGSNPRDAVTYGYQTHLAGVMEKYIPGDYEFDLPKKLINLYNTKDYGIYKDKTGDVPVNFTATNHTTGGNSGSPALDANGNLIGLNFDRQWEGTMSDINYDPRLCRNIMVDTKYILFVIDKYADAKWLINEMKIVK